MDEKIELLKTVGEYIIKLKSGIEKTAEYFQSGEDEQGFNMIPSVTEGLDYIIQAVKVSKDILGKDISVDELNEKLKEIVEAIENEDTVLIGDLFQYELLPIVENIEKSINSVIS